MKKFLVAATIFLVACGSGPSFDNVEAVAAHVDCEAVSEDRGGLFNEDTLYCADGERMVTYVPTEASVDNVIDWFAEWGFTPIEQGRNWVVFK